MYGLARAALLELALVLVRRRVACTAHALQLANRFGVNVAFVDGVLERRLSAHLRRGDGSVCATFAHQQTNTLGMVFVLRQHQRCISEAGCSVNVAAVRQKLSNTARVTRDCSPNQRVIATVVDGVNVAAVSQNLSNTARVTRHCSLH
jgi:hypothetical protein